MTFNKSFRKQPRQPQTLPRPLRLAAFSLLLFCAACAPAPPSQPPAAAPAPATPAGEKAFRWARDPEPATADHTRRAWRNEIRRAIAREMAARGYDRKHGAGAEIAFRMVFTDGTVASLGDFSKRRLPPRGDGSFTIEARDPGNGGIIWRAVVAAPFSPSLTARQARPAIEALVSAMLKALPPAL